MKFKYGFNLLIASGLLVVSQQAMSERPSFTSLQQQINQLQAQINQLESEPKAVVMKDANGNLLGRVAGLDMGPGDTWIITPQGYKTKIRFSGLVTFTRSVSLLFYESIDCTGQAYEEEPPLSYYGTVAMVDNQINGTNQLEYIDKNTTPVTKQIFSGDYGGMCMEMESPDLGGTPMIVIPLSQPNDPLVTGVPNNTANTPYYHE